MSRLKRQTHGPTSRTMVLPKLMAARSLQGAHEALEARSNAPAPLWPPNLPADKENLSTLIIC